ncbi:MAG: hypothetical protein ACREI8_08635 [Myxococcota bacterium]
MTNRPHPSLSRAPQPMPAFVRRALVERDLMGAYRCRPPYQRNDYLGWINPRWTFQNRPTVDA